MASQPNDFALVIGIQHYPRYRSLNGSIADAEAFAHWLTRDPNGGGLPEDHCKLIVSGPEPPVPVKIQIDDAVSTITEASGKNARRFYFYFSGHGMGTGDLDLALCLANWSKSRRQAALSYDGYFNFFIKLGSFREVAFLLDCCRVREIAAGGYGPEETAISISDSAGKVSTFTAFAAELGNPSFEAKRAEEEESQQPAARGHFTEALIEALRGGAAGPGAARGVTAQRLEGYLKRRTAEIAEKHSHSQEARVRPDLAADCPMVFGDYPPAYSVEIVFDQPRAVPVVLFGPTNERILASSADVGPFQLHLSGGVYSLQIDGEEKFFRVSGSAGVQRERF
jgi:hypothetical protein